MSLRASPLEGTYDRYLSARSRLVHLLKSAAAQGILDPNAGPRTAEEIASANGGEPGRVSVLCATLVGYGILNQQGDKFTVSEKFRSLMPSEAIPELTTLFEQEENRLRAMGAAPAGAGRLKVPAHLKLAQLRPLDQPETAEQPPASKVKDSAPPGTPDAAPSGQVVAESVAESKGAEDPDLVAPSEIEGQPSTTKKVKAEVKPPAVPIPPRYRYERPVTPATVASAFVGSWPIGLLGMEVIDRAVRSAVAPRPGRVRRFRYRLGALMWAAAAVCIIWAAWDLWGTGLGQAEAQKELKVQFTRALEQEPAVEPPAVPNSVPGDAPAPVAFTDPPPAPLPGSAIASLKIPAIDLDQMILEGVSVRDLRRGPGHYPGTALPGQPGNAAIAGHRTTYGAPFFRLGKLQLGDEMQVTTRTGTYTYRVTRIYRVNPDDSGPLLPTQENILTLTTCDPPFSAAKRLIVVGTLVGEPDSQPAVIAPKSDPVPSPAPPQPQETTAPGLNLRAIRQGGAPASPSPSPASRQASPAPPAAPPPVDPPATAPVASAPVAQTAETTPTTQPPAPPANQDHLNPFLQAQQQPQVTQPPTAPAVQPQNNSGTVPECSDGIDNDRNGKIDLEDRGCDGDPNEDE